MQKFGAFQSQKLLQINILDSDAGEIYPKKLANFIEKRLKSERAASVNFIHKYSTLNFECTFLFNILLNARSYCNLTFLKRVKMHVYNLMFIYW